jgi:mxaJ protein
MGRGFVREFMDSGQCDVLIGVPADFGQLSTTRPYYRSTYVFLVRRDARVKPASLDDPSLRHLKIGVQALDEQYSPPGQALAHRGLQTALVPFNGVGSNADAIVAAVAARKVDAAVIWGPLAGYLARGYRGALELVPVKPEADPAGLPFTFAIAMGVRKGNETLRAELDAELQRRSAEFRAILDSYAVPQLALTPPMKDAD